MLGSEKEWVSIMLFSFVQIVKDSRAIKLQFCCKANENQQCSSAEPFWKIQIKSWQGIRNRQENKIIQTSNYGISWVIRN